MVKLDRKDYLVLLTVTNQLLKNTSLVFHQKIVLVAWKFKRKTVDALKLKFMLIKDQQHLDLRHHFVVVSVDIQRMVCCMTVHVVTEYNIE